jgi:hypothetical protein
MIYAKSVNGPVGMEHSEVARLGAITLKQSPTAKQRKRNARKTAAVR